jgi:hypothetical protein
VQVRDMLEHLRTTLQEHEQIAINADQRHRRASWQSTLEASLRQSGSLLHQLSKRPTVFVIPTAPGDSKEATTDLAARIRATVAQWTSIWGTGTQDRTLLPAREAPPLLDDALLRRTGYAFPQGTAVVDGVHPANYGQLSPALQDSLKEFLHTCEKAGRLPTECRGDVCQNAPQTTRR